jgi:ribosome-binding protein aMBF1 (putative translation factor)
MGFDVKLKGPDTVEAYDQKAGKVGACLADACENTIYRSTLPELHGKLVEKVEALTNAKREVNTTATQAARDRAKDPAKVKDIMETVPKFVKRATAGMSKEDLAALQTEIQNIADGLEVDPSPSKRQRGPAKDLLAKADQTLTLPEDQRETKITNWLGQVEGFELERDDENVPTRESLALLIGELVKNL